jgi:hypothetical protein
MNHTFTEYLEERALFLKNTTWKKQEKALSLKNTTWKKEERALS